MTFIGRYYHSLEEKGRISIPISFRSKLGEKAIITAGLDGCLFLFEASEWQSIIDTSITAPVTRKNARDWGRYLANNAVEVEFDQLGRILIPEHVRDTANLTKDVVVVGSVNRIEIWDRATYHTYLDALKGRIETVAESIESTSHHD